MLTTRVGYVPPNPNCKRDPRAEGVVINKQMGRGSGPRLLWKGFDESRHIIASTALSARVQRPRKDLYRTIEGPSTRQLNSSLLIWSLGHTFDVEGVQLFSSPKRQTSLRHWPFWFCRLDHRRGPGEGFLQIHILDTIVRQLNHSECLSKLCISVTRC